MCHGVLERTHKHQEVPANTKGTMKYLRVLISTHLAYLLMMGLTAGLKSPSNLCKPNECGVIGILYWIL